MGSINLIKNITKQQLELAIRNTHSLSECTKFLGFSYFAKHSRMAVLRKIQEFGLVEIKFKKRKFSKEEKEQRSVIADTKELLVLNGQRRVSTSYLRKRLIKDGILHNICSMCRSAPEWQNKPLVFHLDHINGNNKDNRIENLRLLCPNCHSQTDTYCGRNAKNSILYSAGIKTRKEIKVYKDKDGNTIDDGRYATKGIPRLDIRKVERPSKEELESLLLAGVPFIRIAAKYGVSDNAVRKWCSFYGMDRRASAWRERIKHLHE